MELRNKKNGMIYKPSSLISFTYDDGSDFWIAEYSSLAELNEDWEDVGDINATNIPLIKDEKIRKAVRAWAEAQGLTEVYCTSNGYEMYGGDDDLGIQFEGEPFSFADRNRTYTIDELCGEEEE